MIDDTYNPDDDCTFPGQEEVMMVCDWMYRHERTLGKLCNSCFTAISIPGHFVPFTSHFLCLDCVNTGYFNVMKYNHPEVHNILGQLYYKYGEFLIELFSKNALTN